VVGRGGLLDPATADTAFTAFAALRNCRIRATPTAITMMASAKVVMMSHTTAAGTRPCSHRNLTEGLLGVLGHEDDEEDRYDHSDDDRSPTGACSGWRCAFWARPAAPRRVPKVGGIALIELTTVLLVVVTPTAGRGPSQKGAGVLGRIRRVPTPAYLLRS
jgi:hypothetical protein